MTVITWTKNDCVELTLDASTLNNIGASSKKVRIPGATGVDKPDLPYESGTRIVLKRLKTASALDANDLRESLARRFSRKILGDMTLTVNAESIPEPPEWNNLSLRVPKKGFKEATLADGKTVRYWYGFGQETIRPRDAAGITVLVRGKVAQTPFVFGSEAGTKQFWLKYLTGVIEADFLDSGVDESNEDVISTDRQAINWEHKTSETLYKFGKSLVSEAVNGWNGPVREEIINLLESDADLKERSSLLVPDEKKKLDKFASVIATTETPDERARELLDTVLRAFEFRQFYDVIGDIESKSDDPDQFVNMVETLREWRVIEARALLQIIEGRIKIVDKFERMIDLRKPERASKIEPESLHDLLSRHPWLLNPSFVILVEEKGIRTLIKSEERKGGHDRRRIDFLALRREKEDLVIIEIKAPAHPVEFAEVQRFQGYVETFGKTYKRVRGVIIADKFNLTPKSEKDLRKSYTVLSWGKVFRDSRTHLEQYRAILSGDTSDPSFSKRMREVAMIESTLLLGATRKNQSDTQLGEQDTNAKPVQEELKQRRRN